MKQTNPNGPPSANKSTPSGSTPSSAPVQPSGVKPEANAETHRISADGAREVTKPSMPADNWLSEWLGAVPADVVPVTYETPLTSHSS